MMAKPSTQETHSVGKDDDPAGDPSKTEQQIACYTHIYGESPSPALKKLLKGGLPAMCIYNMYIYIYIIILYIHCCIFTHVVLI